jgi:hypothetical protein
VPAVPLTGACVCESDAIRARCSRTGRHFVAFCRPCLHHHHDTPPVYCECAEGSHCMQIYIYIYIGASLRRHARAASKQRAGGNGGRWQAYIPKRSSLTLSGVCMPSLQVFIFFFTRIPERSSLTLSWEMLIHTHTHTHTGVTGSLAILIPEAFEIFMNLNDEQVKCRHIFEQVCLSVCTHRQTREYGCTGCLSVC